ncbi:MAG: LysE family translocator [Synergistales bacterium]|nr:LysE family translocator [Synergistales bacterium]
MTTHIEFVPLATFIGIMVFTPGPNNVSSASMGLNFGYRRSMPYIGGLLVGTFAVTFLSGCFSGALVTLLPQVAGWMRWFGAAYILWMAWGVLQTSWTVDEAASLKPLGFLRGLLLPVVNPKLFICNVTLFTTFLSPVAGRPLPLLLVVGMLSVVDFTAISLWAFSGTALGRYVEGGRVRGIVNAILALLLAYTAVSLFRM